MYLFQCRDFFFSNQFEFFLAKKPDFLLRSKQLQKRYYWTGLLNELSLSLLSLDKCKRKSGIEINLPKGSYFFQLFTVRQHHNFHFENLLLFLIMHVSMCSTYIYYNYLHFTLLQFMIQTAVVVQISFSKQVSVLVYATLSKSIVGQN